MVSNPIADAERERARQVLAEYHASERRQRTFELVRAMLTSGAYTEGQFKDPLYIVLRARELVKRIEEEA